MMSCSTYHGGARNCTCPTETLARCKISSCAQLQLVKVLAMSNDNKRHCSVDCGMESEEPPRKICRHMTGGSSTVSLAELLDFSTLSSDLDINIRFEQLAEALLSEYSLILEHGDTQTEFEVLELEFYLQKFGVHEDPFTHGSDEQRYSGRWYVSINIRCLAFVSPNVSEIGRQVFSSRAHTFFQLP